jgi:hypothetical protein
VKTFVILTSSEILELPSEGRWDERASVMHCILPSPLSLCAVVPGRKTRHFSKVFISMLFSFFENYIGLKLRNLKLCLYRRVIFSILSKRISVYNFYKVRIL